MEREKRVTKVRGLAVVHRSRYKATVIGPLDFDITEGRATLLRGENGSGKTTVLRALAGLLDGVSGTVVPPLKRVQFLPQKPSEMLFPWLTLDSHLKYFGGATPAHRRQHLVSILRRLQWPERKDLIGTTPAMLSVGLQQTFALAFVASSPTNTILLLDEPFSSLDSNRRTLAVDLIRWLVEEQRRTVLLASHLPVQGMEVIEINLDAKRVAA